MPKVLVALLTCSKPKWAPRRAFCESTWGKRMPEGYTFEVFDGARLGLSDDYRALCFKTRAICQYAVEHDYDWMIKTDDDIFVRTDQLKIPEGCDYAGRCSPPNPPPYCAGFFYWQSRRAFSINAESPMDSRWDSQEDQWVGWNLSQQGIICRRMPELVLFPPDPIPETWLACCKWDNWSPDLVRGFEARYSSCQV